jgi:hypothetical protein
VFKDWIEDTETTNENILIHDFKWWKIPRMLKTEPKIRAIEKVMARYVDLVKVIFI